MSAGLKTRTRCANCGSADVLRVELSLQGEPAWFTDCHRCEVHWWERDGAVLPLAEVLEAVGRR
jgi:hypothetical protein